MKELLTEEKVIVSRFENFRISRFVSSRIGVRRFAFRLLLQDGRWPWESFSVLRIVRGLCFVGLSNGNVDAAVLSRNRLPVTFT